MALLDSLNRLWRRSRVPATRAAAALLAAASLLAVAGVPVRAQDPASIQQRMDAARAAFQNGDYASVRLVLDKLIDELKLSARTDSAIAAHLASAYEMRARAHVEVEQNQNRGFELAREDLKALLLLDPNRRLPQPNLNRLLKEFEAIRKATVGEVVLVVTPVTASVDVDGRPVSSAPVPIALLPGAPHQVTARRTGYRSETKSLDIVAGAPLQTLVIMMDRVSATLSVASVPPGAEVLVDGVLRGTTPDGPGPDSLAELATKTNTHVSRMSALLIIDGLTIGEHTLEVRKACFETLPSTFPVKELADHDPLLKVLKPATGTITVLTAVEGASVFLDGVPSGSTPKTLPDVCEGIHRVEVSAPYGRFIESVEVRRGESTQLVARPKPMLALLHVIRVPAVPALSPVREGKLRDDLGKLVGTGGSLNLISPPPERLPLTVKGYIVPKEWLSFNDRREALADEAKTLDATTRLDASLQISNALNVNGLATATLDASQGDDHVYLSLLAAGSALPDVLEIDFADNESTRKAANLLTEQRRLFRRDLGLVAIDVADVKGAVVVSVEAGGPAALTKIDVGDTIIRVDGQDLTSANAVSQMLEVLSKAEPNDQVSVLVMNPTSPVRIIQVRLQRTPLLVSMTDRTVLFNKMILDLRARLAAGITKDEEAIARLNLAVSLMAVQNWSDATKELDRVKLPQRRGLSAGTVSYLRGLCLQGLLDHVGAQREFEAALADKDALLTEEGGSVPELAKKVLTGTGMKR